MDDFNLPELPDIDDIPSGDNKSSLPGRIQQVFPRPCVKITVLVFGILVVLLGIVGIIFAILGMFTGGALLDIAFGFINFPPMIIGGTCFIASSLMKKKRPKIDRILSITAVVCFILLCVLSILNVVIKLILGIVAGFTVTDEDVKELDPEGKNELTTDSVRNMYIILSVIGSIITCCCCVLYCLPCLITSFLNCMHTYPQGDDDESTTPGSNNQLEIPDTGGFGELVDEHDEDIETGDIQETLDDAGNNKIEDDLHQQQQQQNNDDVVEAEVMQDDGPVEYSTQNVDDNITYRD